MPWKKGQSGNPSGVGGDRAFAAAIRLVVNEDDRASGQRKLRRIAEVLVDRALAGEPWAIMQVGDRLDGKPVQESHQKHERRDLLDMSDAELLAIVARGEQTIEHEVTETQERREPVAVLPAPRQAGRRSSTPAAKCQRPRRAR